MNKRVVIPGFLILAMEVATVFAGIHDVFPQVRTRVFEIEYQVNDTALPLKSAQLWYTLDGGKLWQAYGLDEDRHSPVTFHSTTEGLHGFFMILANGAGPSSPPPAPSTPPMLSVFVDYTPPVIQLHPLQPILTMGERVLQIRWTAVDEGFGPRPVELTYQRPPAEDWHPIIPDPLANTGRFDWRLPTELAGSITVRAVVTDQGGHRVESERQIVELASTEAEVSFLDDAKRTSSRFVSAESKSRAAKLFAEGLEFRRRSEYHEGIARMRDVVRIDPQRADAFVELADMLLTVGDTDKAQDAYGLALKLQPAMRAALFGSAMIHRQKRDYVAAAEQLRAILRQRPNDAETWLQMGDIAVYQGDELLARDYYTRASQIDPTAERIASDARQRLALMAEASRTYRTDRP